MVSGHMNDLMGTLGCIRNHKTEEKIIQNRKKNSAKTENRIQNRQNTDTILMVTSATYRANYANTLFHQSICECHGHV